MNIWNESLYAIYIVTESIIIYDQSVNFFLPMGDQGDHSMEIFSHTFGISFFFHAVVSNIPST